MKGSPTARRAAVEAAVQRAHRAQQRLPRHTSHLISNQMYTSQAQMT
jgi:hypothetical protein